MGRRGRRAARLGAVTAVAALAAACSSTSGTGPASTAGLQGPSGRPVTVGVSLPLTGDLAAGGLASQRGYQLWADDVNAHGGLLGRPVRLIIRDDRSDGAAVTRDYETLIGAGHADLTLAPFSAPLTADAAKVTARHHYVLVAGSACAPGGGQPGSPLLFSTAVPVASEMEPLVAWIGSLPAGERPATAAYLMLSDPFAGPPVQDLMGKLPALGVRTVYSKAYRAGSTAAQLAADASEVIALHPDMVVLGSADVPTVSAFIGRFASEHFGPAVFVASAGPDQGQAFLKAVGAGNATGVMVPAGWYASAPNALSHLMVQDYIARYGGTGSGINAAVAEAYSAGEVLANGVSGAGSLSNSQIAGWLHAHAMQTVAGPARFSGRGENLAARQSALIFQWQPGQRFLPVLPASAAGPARPLFPKPAWGG
jgi:branched-chain amino acid transport system substrate-binding protein